MVSVVSVVPPVAPRGDLVLSGPITAETVGPIRQLLLRYLLDSSTTCLIQALGVTEMDTAGAQLLYSFVSALGRRAATVRWVSVSPDLLVAARSLGMEACLGLCSAIARPGD
jgi:anti-anti-sigma regulatory factor